MASLETRFARNVNRQYGVFERSENGKRWVRLYPHASYSLPVARKVFQPALLAYVYCGTRERQLRPIGR